LPALLGSQDSGVCTKYTRHLLQWQWYAACTQIWARPGLKACLFGGSTRLQGLEDPGPDPSNKCRRV